MRQAMLEAEVGDDVYGEDPTVNRLEQMAAELTGKEAALFASSGTQTNLLALMSHCQRGDEYIVGQQAHTYKYEGGGAAVLGSIQPQPLNALADGTLDVEEVANAVKPPDFHFARTRLLCLENTHHGMALPLEYFPRAKYCCEQQGLKLHLDGARLGNAAVKYGVSIEEITRHVDSVSLCLSKGLGAPVGSLLCADHGLIAKARRWRKMLGGGMRQAGLLAAAGIFSLQHNFERLAEDHVHAAQLANGLAGIEEVEVGFLPAQTNMVFISVDEKHTEKLRVYLKQHGVLISSGTPVRLVIHLDVSGQEIRKMIDLCRQFFINVHR